MGEYYSFGLRSKCDDVFLGEVKAFGEVILDVLVDVNFCKYGFYIWSGGGFIKFILSVFKRNVDFDFSLYDLSLSGLDGVFVDIKEVNGNYFLILKNSNNFNIFYEKMLFFMV